MTTVPVTIKPRDIQRVDKVTAWLPGDHFPVALLHVANPDGTITVDVPESALEGDGLETWIISQDSNIREKWALTK